MTGMFGDLKKLNTPTPPLKPTPPEATAQSAVDSRERPIEASVLPLKRVGKEMSSSSTPLPRKHVQTEREERPGTEESNLPANPQASKPASQHAGLPANPQAGIPATQQVSNPVSPQTSKPVKKFTSYLSEGSIRALKRCALDEDKKDYEVLQEAVDAYLQQKDSKAN